MKLNHEEFVRLLARALDSDEEKAARDLSDWVDSVLDEIKNSGTCHLEGLGTFREEDAKIFFSPDETLSLEINYKFAGMGPIEISEPLRRAESSQDPEKTEQPDAPKDLPDTAETDSDKPPAEELDATREPVEDDPFALDDAGEPELEFETESEPEFEPEAETETEPESEPEEGAFEKADEPDPEAETDPDSSYKPLSYPRLSVSQKKKIEEERESEKTPAPGSKSRSNRLVWLVPVAAVLIVAILLFFHFDGLRLDRKHAADPAAWQEQEPAPVSPEEQVVTAQDEEPAVHELVPGPEPVEEVAAEPDVDITPDPVEDVPSLPLDQRIDELLDLPYGLRGPEDEVLIGAYTIVVHSVRNERKSEIEKKRLENRGYKATRWSVVLPNENVTWRVGVGQFKSVSDAQIAAEELPEPYRSNNFIIRIR